MILQKFEAFTALSYLFTSVSYFSKFIFSNSQTRFIRSSVILVPKRSLSMSNHIQSLTTQFKYILLFQVLYEKTNQLLWIFGHTPPLLTSKVYSWSPCASQRFVLCLEPEILESNNYRLYFYNFRKRVHQAERAINRKPG